MSIFTDYRDIAKRAERNRLWKESSRKAWTENRQAEIDYKTYQSNMENMSSGTRRLLNQRPDSGVKPPKNIAIGAGQVKIDTRNTQEVLDHLPWQTEQGRGKVKTDYGHSKSVAGDKRQYIETPSPLTSSMKVKDADGKTKRVQIPQRGADTGKTTFPESKRFNVHMGPKDSFSLEEMNIIGRPTNWAEAIADDEAFGNKTMIDIDYTDWMRLQQKAISADELVSHKLWVKDIADQGDIWIDALDHTEAIRVVDYKQGKASLKRHWDGPSGLPEKVRDLKARTWESKVKKPIQKLAKNVGLPKVSGRISKADAMAQLGMNISTGNIPGAVVNASALSLNLIGQSPAVQKRFAELAIKLTAERGVKSGLKLIPGVDIVMSGAEAWSYASEGKFDQATLAAISGAIGWVPGLGDLGAALIDATNTGIDVVRLSKKQRKKKPEVVDLKTKRRSALKAIARDIKRGL